MTRPNFLIIGTAKAGTTSLYRYLAQHPQIYMSPLKEPNFFALEGQDPDFCGPGDDQFIGRFSVTDPEAYGALFGGVRDEIAVGEASPLYLYSPAAPARICRDLPGVKLIALLRHPVERAYSAFLHLLRDGREPLTNFACALEAEEERIRSNWEHIWHYRQMGFYAAQLRRYYRCFRPEQIRVYLYDTFQKDPTGVIADILRFLEVDPTFTPDLSVRHNESYVPREARPPLHPEVRGRLLEGYRDDILRLERMLQTDLGPWLS